jgi:hypothetical protein
MFPYYQVRSSFHVGRRDKKLAKAKAALFDVIHVTFWEDMMHRGSAAKKLMNARANCGAILVFVSLYVVRRKKESEQATNVSEH